MSDSDDLFGASSNDEGGDTDELIAASKAADAKPIAKKKKSSGGGRLKKKSAAKNIPDADNDSDDEATGLFDSDEEGDDNDNDDSSPKKKLAAKKKAPKKKAGGKPMTKREKMEALRAKKRAANGEDEKPKRKGDKKKSSDPDAEKEKGYNSGNSYDSGAEYVRNKDDDDFIDVEGEDEEVVKEYYREQQFDDERPEGYYSDDEDEGGRKKGRGGKSSGSKRKAGPDTLSAADKADEDNPMMQAVNRMKKKKKVVRTFEEVKDLAQEFVASMDNAADHDDIAMQEKRVPLSKLKMLSKAVEIMTKVDMMRPLLEADVLVAIKRWIKPMRNGSLGNVTVRQRLLECISKMTGENGIDTDDLKRSEFGKLAMVLYKHKKETPQIKKILRGLIEQWSRQIFKKSGDMRDLQSAQTSRRREGGLAAISRAYAVANEEEEAAVAAAARSKKRSNSSKRGLMEGGDLGDVISNGVKQGRDTGKNRVRIPYSKGFQYTVRPSDVTGDVSDKKTRISTVKEARGSLHKRMLEKTRPVSKNSRSANISIEGRVAK